MRLIIEPIVRAALLEDLGRAGDVTTEAIVPEEATVEAVVSARQRRSRMAPCSFQSASSCTRPCCISTALKCFDGSKRCRL